MKTDTQPEARFIADVEAFEIIERDLQQSLADLADWRTQCENALATLRLSWQGLHAPHPLARQASLLNDALSACLADWQVQWQRLAPAQALAGSLGDKVVLLVFGKFNAGKSSFCNVLAERFAASGLSVEYFHLDAGQLVEGHERFKEGATETTARLQGVLLAGKLVLLDTPGLHSVTAENAELTQRFTDSADAVLWLTSSTSPGQVQELDELGKELHRHKPLLPVLTRSDVFDEDDINGELVKILRAKTPANRAEQEDDVTARARQKLLALGVSTSLLRRPVSISSLLARQQQYSQSVLEQAGLETLYTALTEIVEPALDYKRRKQAEIVLHHLEEHILGAFGGVLAGQITQMREALSLAHDALPGQRDDMATALWRTVVPQLPAMLDAYVDSRDSTTAGRSLANAINGAYQEILRANWDTYEFATVGPLMTSIDADVLDGGDASDATSANVDYQGLYSAWTGVLRQQALALADTAVAQIRMALNSLDSQVDLLDSAVSEHTAEFQTLKAALRAPNPDFIR